MKILVAGIGTDVGKTIVSAVLTTLLNGDYWKPIESGIQWGEESDVDVMRSLLDSKKHHIHPSAYSFQAPLSPHHAARLEGRRINIDSITLPITKRALIIESAGGIFVPLKTNFLSIDLFKKWDCKWVVVSRHYVGSINHTLLTINALKQQGIDIAGIVFNGEENPDSESAIIENSKVAFLGRLLPESFISPKTIQRYAIKWKKQLPLII